jgi:NodT family efflux transporter outer membrane factor (OMF) lipoprotein
MRTRPYAGHHAAVLAAAMAAALGGCALQSPPPRDELQRQAMPHTSVPTQWRAGGGQSGAAAQPALGRWLASFDDPVLSALVDEALAYNADLQAAAARVEQATGYLQVAGATLLPAVGVAGTWSGKSGSGGGINGIWLNASLELDVWGRIRYGEAAASQQLAATEADYAYARQSLAATVAKSWFVAIEASLQRALLQDTVATAEKLLQLAQDRQRIGAGNELSVAEARANVASYRDALRQADLALQNALRALELLLGRYPAADVKVAANFPPMPAPVPVGLPSQLLERRPDVVAAERRVAAAFNRVGEAKAAQLPRLSLTAGVSAISSDVFVLQDRQNPSWGFGGNLLAPLYQGGALRAQVDIRSAEQKGAVAAYASTGQRAFGEVENALAAEFALRDRALIVEAQVRDNERALELALVQYRVGTVDQRSVEQRQIALYGARTTKLRVQSEQLAQRVNLYLALGGSFDDVPAVPVAARAASAPTP